MSCNSGPGDERDHIYTLAGCGGRADLGPAKFAYYREDRADCALTPDYSQVNVVSGDGSSSWDFYDLCARNGLAGNQVKLCQFNADSGSYVAADVVCPCDPRVPGGP